VSPIEELLFTAERLADELDSFRREFPCLQLNRIVFVEDDDGGADNDIEEKSAEDYLDARSALEQALRDYRRAQQRELSERALRCRSNGKAARA
jgi:hypothetical protein